VRSDKTDTNFVLLTYEGENSNVVKLLASGAGGINELVEHLNDSIVGYGLVRVQEKFDESDIVRFVYIRWVGPNIHRMLKARIGTHSGGVKELVAPFHVDIEADRLSELEEHVVRDVVRKNAGIASRVLDKTVNSAPTPGQKFTPSGGGARATSSSSPKGSASIPKEGPASVTFSNKSEIESAIRDVRSDLTDTDWVLASYDGPNSNNIVLLGSGAGGAQELISNLKDDIVAYGIVREVHRFDDSNTVKFAFINWQGQNIHRMLRAKLGTHSGAVKELFQPYHVDLIAEKHEEISPEIVSSLIKTNMGTATRVRGS